MVETKKKVTTSETQELNKNIQQLVIRIDHLVELFEEASKHVAEAESAEIKIAELSQRLDVLLEQNKSIAKGLILLEKYVRGKTRLDSSVAPNKLSEYGGL